jgi:hypothetical protein
MADLPQSVRSGFVRYELGGEKYSVLVEKAQDLADQMIFAWIGVMASPACAERYLTCL